MRQDSGPRHAVEAVIHPDPWPYYQSLRDARALYYDDGIGLWVASTHDTVSQALAHPQLRVRPPSEPVPEVLLGTAAGEMFAQLVRMTDGDFHAAHKPAVQQAARRWTLADVARASEAATQDLMPVEDINEFMGLLPVRAMARLLAVPHEQLDNTCGWVRCFVAGIAPGASPQAVERAAQSASALMAQGRALGLPEVAAANRIALMQQSLDATAALFGHTALMLASEPALAEIADASPDAMRRFVTEVERFCSPTQNTRRFAAEALALAGQRIEAGQGVLVLLASANRDAQLNADPDRFDPDRLQPRTMGFGDGRHACPGAAIAIEMVASGVRWMSAKGRFGSYFRVKAGFRPFANIRSPLFEKPQES